MNDIVALIVKAGDNNYIRESREHRAVMDELARRDASLLSPEERGHVHFYLTRSILDEAQKTGAYRLENRKDGNGNPYSFPVVDEENFPEELSYLRKLSEQLRYSSALDGWLTRKRHEFVDEFRRDPALMTGKERWPTMTSSERKAFLTDVIRRRLDSFSDRDFSFAMPEIEITAGNADGLSGRAHTDKNKIEFDKSIFEIDDPAIPLKLAYHEGTHNILTQMAMAADEGKIASAHPLCDDIQKRQLSTRHKMYDENQIQSLYKANDEERVCYQEQEYFLGNLSNGYGLRHKFDLVRYVAQQYFVEDKTIGLKALIHGLRCV